MITIDDKLKRVGHPQFSALFQLANAGPGNYHDLARTYLLVIRTVGLFEEIVSFILAERGANHAKEIAIVQ